MGAWGTGTFDNDTACDWSAALEEVDDLSLVADAMERVLKVGGEYLDSDVSTEALAACEVIARLHGHWGLRNSYTETVDRWVVAHPIEPSAELVEKALATIDRVLSRPSELLELWEEGGRNDEWRAAVDHLRQRVAPF
jgi:hypothetical protein